MFFPYHLNLHIALFKILRSNKFAVIPAFYKRGGAVMDTGVPEMHHLKYDPIIAFTTDSIVTNTDLDAESSIGTTKEPEENDYNPFD